MDARLQALPPQRQKEGDALSVVRFAACGKNDGGEQDLNVEIRFEKKKKKISNRVHLRSTLDASEPSEASDSRRSSGSERKVKKEKMKLPINVIAASFFFFFFFL